MKSIYCVLAGLFWAISATLAPAQAAAKAGSEPAFPSLKATVVRSDLTGQLLYELLLGEILFTQGDASHGVELLLNAARRTGNEALYQRATEMAIQSRSGPAAVQTTRAWRAAFPHSAQAARFELQVLLVLGQIEKSAAPLRELLTALPSAERQPFVLALPAIYQRSPDHAKAAQTVEAALSAILDSPTLGAAAWTTVGRLRLMANDKAGALVAATLGRASDPQSEWPALLALQLLRDADIQAAEPLVIDYINTAQAKPEVSVNYIRTLIDQGRNENAHTQLRMLTKKYPDYPEGWLLLGAVWTDEQQDERAESALQRYLQLASKEAADKPGIDRQQGRNQANILLARIAARRGDLQNAQKLLNQIQDPDQIMKAQLMRAQLLADNGRLNEARQAIRSIPEDEPDDARNKVLAEAQLLLDHGQAELAYQMLLGELKSDPDDENLLYETAIAAERADRWLEMERLLRRQIQLNPKAAIAYNALGFSLAERSLRLREAKRLIQRALQITPDDVYIQDSLGWVEFRLGHSRRARDILQAAFQKRPDPEIAAHLGEVQWILGDRDAAMATWREGLRLNPKNPTLLKTLERLKVSP